MLDNTLSLFIKIQPSSCSISSFPFSVLWGSIPVSNVSAVAERWLHSTRWSFSQSKTRSRRSFHMRKIEVIWHPNCENKNVSCTAILSNWFVDKIFWCRGAFRNQPTLFLDFLLIFCEACHSRLACCDEFPRILDFRITLSVHKQKQNSTTCLEKKVIERNLYLSRAVRAPPTQVPLHKGALEMCSLLSVRLNEPSR